jgi:uncharacterized protein (TIGR04222 family)
VTNPLGLRGPEFLALYLILLFIAVGVAFLIRWTLRAPADEPIEEPGNLDPYEAAYLAAGASLAVDAAIASLVQRETLAVETGGRRLTIAGRLRDKSHDLERAVYKSIAAEAGATVEAVRPDAKRAADKIRQRLEDLGLVVADGAAWTARLSSVVPIGALIVLGLMKIQVGMSRNRPVSFLVILCILSALIAVAFLAVRPLRSRRGDRVLGRLKHENAALQYAAQPESAGLAGDDLALAVALFGTSILVAGPLAGLRAALLPPPSSGSGGGCGGGSSCGGGGCGGGGGGCGGCGS